MTASAILTPAALVHEIERLHAIEMDGTSWQGKSFNSSPGSVAQAAMWSHLKMALDDPALVADARLMARATRCLVQSAGGLDLPNRAALLLAETVLSVPVAGSDAAILAACADLDKLEQEYAAVSLADEDSPRLNEISDAQGPLIDLLGRTRAKTADGIRAKAHCLALAEPSLVAKGTGDAFSVLTGSILRDLIGEAVLSDAPDAAILAACENARRLRQERDQKPDLDDAAYTAAVYRHEETLLEVVRLSVVTPVGMAAVAALLLEETDDGAKANALEAWLQTLASTAAPTANPDTSLIALCDECCRLEAESVRLYRLDGDENEKESNRLDDEGRALFDQIAKMEPITTEGRAAFARVALWYVGREADGATISTDYIGEQLAWKLVRQFAGGDQRAEMFGGAA